MSRWLSNLARKIAGLFRFRRKNAEQPRWVGMYLSQNNSRGAMDARSPGRRERQNGRFAQNRRRGG